MHFEKCDGCNAPLSREFVKFGELEFSKLLPDGRLQSILVPAYTCWCGYEGYIEPPGAYLDPIPEKRPYAA